MSPKKSWAVPHEVTVRKDRKNAQSSLKVANDATNFALCEFPISVIVSIFLFSPLQFIHLNDNNQNLSKRSDT